MLLEAGALGHVVPLLLRYDATLGPELLQEHVQPFTPAGPAPILQVGSLSCHMLAAHTYPSTLCTTAPVMQLFAMSMYQHVILS
jgi:hypothetical protein